MSEESAAPDLVELSQRLIDAGNAMDFDAEYKQDMNNVHFEPEQIIELGDRIAVRVTFVGEGALSGPTTRNATGNISWISPRGTVTRLDIYWTWDEALAALERPD
jgi:hypothetical protein